MTDTEQYAVTKSDSFLRKLMYSYKGEGIICSLKRRVVQDEACVAAREVWF